MLTEQQLQEIREYLQRAKNPLYFFDEDHDGMTAYLLLRRKYKKGKGVAAKTRQGDDSLYVHKIQETHSDLVLFLDRPEVSQEVIDHAHCPVLWIDHHQPLKRERVHYYNPMVLTPGDNRPTSYWCYQIVQQDEWLAMVGIIGDWHVPDFAETFQYKELFNGKKTPPEILFDSEFGKLIKIFNFVLKGTTTDARKYLAVLEKIQSPYEILRQETARGKFVYKKYEKLNKEYEALLRKALDAATKDRIYIFTYTADKNSFSGGLSNELLHRLDKDMFIIARENDHGEMVASIRGKTMDVLPLLQAILKTVPGNGGGHMRACGAVIRKEDFERFVSAIKKEFLNLKKQKK